MKRSSVYRAVSLTLAALLSFSACGVSKTAASTPAASSAAAASEAAAPPQEEEKVSAPGVYAGYSQPIYDELGYERHSQYVEMSDGVKIAVDYYLPTKDGVAVKEAMPTIFHLTPYDRVSYTENGETSEYNKDGLDPDAFLDLDIMSLLKYGYVVAVADVRGMGASYGLRLTTNSRREAQDGAEIIEWLAQQDFCNGKVGTTGYSYTGQTQLEMISMKPEHLVASTVGMTDYNKYDGWFRGGIPRAFGTEPDTQWGDTPEEQEQTIREKVDYTVPVDDDPDKTQLYEAVKEHMGSLSQIKLFKTMLWRDSFCEETGTELWQDVSASTYKDDINDSGVAIYCFGGTYDVFRRDTFTMYHNLTTPKKMLIGTWYHMDSKEDILWKVEQLRWFDYWLKGIDNGVMDEEPITLKVGNYNFETMDHQGEGTGEVVYKENWPVDEGSRDTIYLTGEQTLAAAPAQEQAVAYDVKYGIKTSVESKLTTNDDGNGLDQLGLVFTGQPLTADYEIIGHPDAKVSFSLEDAGWMTDNYDLDLFVSLSDYDPATDKAFLITEGQLRTSLRTPSENCPYDFLGLPWFEDNTGSNEYLELGKVYDVAFDMMPTAYKVKAGHCLRVTIAGSCDRMYYYGCDEFAADPNVETPDINIYVGGENGTRLILPNLYAPAK